jgi:amino acid transporter
MFVALKPAQRKMRLLPLIAATYFMVSGGPYGIEDILGGAGYGRAIAILLILPILWCLPTALMIGELASAIPAEGGFYIWVRRALGPFWGYQESWLSLSASIFDMALYPAIFVLYLSKFSPGLTAGWKGYAWSLGVVVLCGLWNLRGAPAVGADSVWLFVLLLAPFAIFVALGLWKGSMLHPAVQWGNLVSAPAAGFGAGSGFSTAVLVAMWNYMGWDLHSAAGGHGGRRPLRGQLFDRRLGRRCPSAGRNGTRRSGAGNGCCRRRLHHRHRHV